MVSCDSRNVPLDWRKMQTPLPCGAPKRIVQTVAERYARAVGFEPGGSIEDVVRALGGKIEFRTFLGNANSESITVRSENDFDIFLPADTSPQRDRFTIAHELAHLLLHYPVVKQKSGESGMQANRYMPKQPSQEDQRCEWEANWFAAAFLMPEQAFRDIWDQSGGNISRIAQYFTVSVQAAENRAKSLGLI